MAMHLHLEGRTRDAPLFVAAFVAFVMPSRLSWEANIMANILSTNADIICSLVNQIMLNRSNRVISRLLTRRMIDADMFAQELEVKV